MLKRKYVTSVVIGDIMFCKECGSKMVPLHSPPWTLRYKCSSCTLRLEIVCGDALGGSSDDYYYKNSPFDEEIEVNLEGVQK